MKIAMPKFATLTFWLLPAALVAAPIPDVPFWQDVAVRIHQAPELTNATFKKLCVDKENIVYVLTSKGVARVFEDTLALDKSYRPLAGKIAKDIALTLQGDLETTFTTHLIGVAGRFRVDPDAPSGIPYGLDEDMPVR